MKLGTAVFGSGCFWCSEAVFRQLRGVKNVEPGYAGGTTPNPSYHQLGDHAEVIRVVFDPVVISYDQLLTVFFATHDPTSLNRQGNDVGPQYRSIILFNTDAQRQAAERQVQEINSQSDRGTPVVTLIQPLKHFYPAESYHRDFYANHQAEPYCQVVINPKLVKVKQQFRELLAS